MFFLSSPLALTLTKKTRPPFRSYKKKATMHLAAIKTTSPEMMAVDYDPDCKKEEEASPQTPSYAVSPSFALLAANAANDNAANAAAAPTPRATFDVPATAESLPSDVLWRLATLLPVQDLPAMMAVCRSWRGGFGAAIDVLAPSSLSDDDAGAAASFLPRRFPCLRSLDLSSVPAAAATDRALSEPLARLTGLTRLSLRGCRALTAGGLAKVLSCSGLPRLRSLDLSGCVGLGLLPSNPPPPPPAPSATGGFAAALPEGSLAGLEEFSADRVPRLGDGDVEALARALFRSSSSSPPPSSSASSSSPARGLVKLSLDGAGKLTGRGLAALPFPRRLQRLSLAGCASLCDAGLAEGLRPFSSDFSGCSGCDCGSSGSGSGCSGSGCGSGCGGSSSLAELVLDRCPLVTGSGLAGAAPSPSSCFPALRRLSARDSGIDDAGLAAAAAAAAAAALASSLSSPGGDSSRSCSCRIESCRFPALEELVLDGCSAVTDHGVDALSARKRGGAGATATAAVTVFGGLPSLASLSLARLPHLQGWGLSSLLDSSESLTSLCLSGCLRLGDAAAQAIGEDGRRRRGGSGGCGGLEVLDVSDCERVGVAFFAALRGAPLRRLRASRCPRLSPAAVEALGAGRARETLEELEASGCAALVADSSTGGGLSAVAAALPNLVSLDLSATPLTQRGLRELLFLLEGEEGGAPQQLRLRLPSLAALNLACCPRLSRPAVQRLLASASAAAAAAAAGAAGGRGRLRVNSWGCKEEEDEEEERPSVVVENSSSSPSTASSPVLSFGHLSPQRGNRAAAAALAAAA